jgi:hypothetical protein
MHAAAQLADRLACAEEALGRDAAERQDDLGLEHGQLRGKERRARGELVGLGIAIARRPAHDRVADVDLVAGELDLARLEHLGEELSGPADERKPLGVLVGARAFADHHELGAWIARPEHDRRPPLAELALAAALNRLLQRRQRFRGSEQILAREREVADAEIAMVAESLAQRAERVGEQGAGIRGRMRLGGRLAGRRGGPQREDVREDRVGDVGLRHLRQRTRAAPAVEQEHFVVLGLEPDALLAHVVRHEQIDPLALELRARVGDDVVGLGGEADDERARVPRSDFGEDVGGSA